MMLNQSVECYRTGLIVWAPCPQQVFFVESVCDDPEVIAANIMVCI